LLLENRRLMTEEFPFFARAYQWLCRDIRDKPLSPLIDTLKDKLRQRRRHRL
jgi:hypothetical protein